MSARHTAASPGQRKPQRPNAGAAVAHADTAYADTAYADTAYADTAGADGPGDDAEAEPLLYTVEAAATLLQVRPSWLRRKAAARTVPCAFLGKHLRFSRTDLDAIIAGGSQPTGPPRQRLATVPAARRPTCRPG